MKEDTGRMISFGAALAGDVISLAVPGGGFFSKLADEYLARKSQEAIDIAIEELRLGRVEFEEADAQPFVAMLLRYSKAASEGASRKNLRLLMKVVVGLKRNKTLSEDLFKRWAGVVEHMTRDELMLLGHAVALQRRIDDGDEAADKSFWKTLKVALAEGGYPDLEHSALAAAVSRSGLIIPSSAYGGMSYRPSPWLKDLSQLITEDFLLSKDE